MTDIAPGSLVGDAELVNRVAKALHVFHGTGYCTQGQHLRGLNFHCQDEARAVLAVIDGQEAAPDSFPVSKRMLTLSARPEAKRRFANQGREKK